LGDINKYTDDNPVKLVVGNKSDLSDQRHVSQVYINNFKQQTRISVMKASAKNSFKIIEIMETITRLLIHKKTKIGVFNNSNTSDDNDNITLDESNSQKNEDSQNCCNISSFI
jgi:GTPase SAR1 family protein